MMKIIKLTTPWDHNFNTQTPNGKGIVHGFKFEINNDCSECDYWIVWGGLKKAETVFCPKNNVFYMTDESHSERRFNQLFLNQFHKVIACRTDLQHKAIIKTHDLGIWHLKKNYEEITNIQPFTKSKKISVVSSDLTYLEGHKKRFGFVNKMIGHFKDRLDVFGRGFNYILDKFDGIADYKYSIAVENSVIPDYFTEKLFECYLTYTMPIYYGCPNITDYFNERSLLLIDIDDYRGSITKIEEAIEGDLYDKCLPYIIEARENFLKYYHVFPSLISIIKKEGVSSFKNSKIKNTINPEMAFVTPQTSPSKNNKHFFNVMTWNLFKRKFNV